MCLATGSPSFHLPSSHSIIMAAPTVGLVIEAMRKMESVATAGGAAAFQPAIGVQIDHLAVAGHQRDDAGQLLLVDKGVHLPC